MALNLEDYFRSTFEDELLVLVKKITVRLN